MLIIQFLRLRNINFIEINDLRIKKDERLQLTSN